jgi:hypothetical protein
MPFRPEKHRLQQYGRSPRCIFSAQLSQMRLLGQQGERPKMQAIRLINGIFRVNRDQTIKKEVNICLLRYFRQLCRLVLFLLLSDRLPSGYCIVRAK